MAPFKNNLVRFRRYLPVALFDIIRKGRREFSVSWKRVPKGTMLRDFFSVAASIGFVFIPALLVGLIFAYLTQGRDTLILVMEKLSVGNPWALFCLLIGLFFWSVTSEFSVRYAIYISDNSGKNLTDERVYWRKTVQKALAGFFLLYPFILVIADLIYCFFLTDYIPLSERILSFGLSILLLSLLVLLQSQLYFHKFGSFAHGKYYSTILGERSLPDSEQRYVKKLYGIYEDFVFAMPNDSILLNPHRRNLQAFTREYNPKLPQDTAVFKPLYLVPSAFELVDRAEQPTKKGELYKWRYQIPASFYRTLHRQLRWLAISAILIFLIICFLPGDSPFFTFVAAPALICTAFACYCALYTGLLYIDKCLRRKRVLSLRLILVVILLGVSYFNADHPVRTMEAVTASRPLLSQHFNSWFASYKQKIDAQGNGAKKYPVIFLCAEGGALRTGAYSAMYLTALENQLANQYGIDFRNSVYAMSGVSGGALGIGVYHALAYRGPETSTKDGQTAAKGFFAYDSLSPIVGKMLFGDLLNLLIPVHINRLDRSIALEKSWEKAMDSSR